MGADDKVEIIKQGNNRYGIMMTFEIGNSGEYEQRITNSNLSLKQAELLKKKIESKEIYR